MASAEWRINLPVFLFVVGCLLMIATAIIYTRRRADIGKGEPSVDAGGKRQRRSKLIIHSATYAAAESVGKSYDVTEFMQQIITGDSLVLDIENHNFVVDGHNFVPHDPFVGKPKRLKVNYSYDGGTAVPIERNEHSRLVLPQDSESEQLADKMRGLLNDDTANLRLRIRQSSQRFEFHFSPASDPYIDIITELWNGSIFGLVNLGDIAGHATYAGKQLAGDPRVTDSVEPVVLSLHRADSVTLVVRQYLSVQVADEMQANRNLNRHIPINFESVFVPFQIVSGLTKVNTYRWQGPRFVIEDAKRV